MSNAGKAIFWGGLCCGVLDISSAVVTWGIRNQVGPMRIFQSVAGGLIGRPAAIQGGTKTAMLGLALHFLIAFTAAAVYYAASRPLGFLRRQPIVWGLIYGEVVFLFMNMVVLPLSALHVPPLQWASLSPWPTLVTGPIGHPFLVGLPIALATWKYSSGNR